MKVLKFNLRLAKAVTTLREHYQHTLAECVSDAARRGDRSDLRSAADEVKALGDDFQLPKLQKAAERIYQELEDTLC